MISLRQRGISTALFCMQTKEALSLVEAWLGFSWGDQVIPTNDALRESRGSLGIGWLQHDAGMHGGNKLAFNIHTDTADQRGNVRLKVPASWCKETSSIVLCTWTYLWTVLQHCLMLQNTVQCTSVARINLQQRAPWMLSIYSSWLRFLKGIRGFLRMPCSVFREKGLFSLTEKTVRQTFINSSALSNSDNCFNIIITVDWFMLFVT